MFQNYEKASEISTIIETDVINNRARPQQQCTSTLMGHLQSPSKELHVLQTIHQLHSYKEPGTWEAIAGEARLRFWSYETQAGHVQNFYTCLARSHLTSIRQVLNQATRNLISSQRPLSLAALLPRNLVCLRTEVRGALLQPQLTDRA